MFTRKWSLVVRGLDRLKSILLLISILGPSLFPEVKAIKYLFVLYPLFFFQELNGKLVLKTGFQKGNLILAVLSLFGIMINLNSPGLVLFLVLVSTLFLTYLRYMNMLLSIVLFYFLIYVTIGLIFGVEVRYDIESFVGSNTSDFEYFLNQYTFIFPMLFIYFWGDANYKSLIAFVLSIIVFKRIAFLALILGFVILIFRIRLSIKYLLFTIFSLVSLYLYFCYHIRNEFVASFISEMFGYDVGYLMMGRNILYGETWDNLTGIYWLLGAGAGASSLLTLELYDDLLHNDLLKVLYEFGVVALLVLLHNYIRDITSTKVLALYSLLLLFFATDNILIYPQPMLVLGMCLISLRRKDLSSLPHGVVRGALDPPIKLGGKDLG